MRQFAPMVQFKPRLNLTQPRGRGLQCLGSHSEAPTQPPGGVVGHGQKGQGTPKPKAFWPFSGPEAQKRAYFGANFFHDQAGVDACMAAYHHASVMLVPVCVPGRTLGGELISEAIEKNSRKMREIAEIAGK